jgi:hypothetical protein
MTTGFSTRSPLIVLNDLFFRSNSRHHEQSQGGKGEGESERGKGEEESGEERESPFDEEGDTKAGDGVTETSEEDNEARGD